ncbi:Helicase conserved C-terminal domain-containing protein [Paenibacillus sp. UNCCL117]|uniref:DEAD/DEAH box helicase n=1 Tax=unclassified Paenibacillus TaxID=185978 RepID=UPI00088F1762|nr:MULTISPECIES: SNF2-related protein [unclassified Paenibacillus]SDC25858.1 Helicase conserved C-terminal domain-containing protein [Paenibacillus sp. cl123]SFW19937.1 Helicase conserved C-terminal domain-containing protein [Paenibacillus sp. UNCCL117]
MQKTERKEHVRPLNEHVELHFEREWFEELHARAQKNGPWDDWSMFRLACEAERAGMIGSFDDLLCLSHLPNLVPMDHQIGTAKKVLTEMRGRAILADEVGLGKTIEAGLILKEYMIRGLVRKVLILVPASLVLQWVRELNQKFGIPAVAQKKEYMWAQHDIIVASMDTAKRDPHRGIVLEQEYDMLIIDEAHKLKNKKTTNYQFVLELRKKYCLLLTATPVQNDLKELYNLITLLKPGQLGGQTSFQANFVVDKRIPKNEAQLQQELGKVMIRNRRSDGNVSFTKRIVRNIPLQLSPEEQALYDGVTSFVRSRYEESGGDLSSVLSLVTLQREVCSSRDAVFITLVNMFKKTEEDSPIRPRIWELVETIRGIKANTKAEKVLELIQSIQDKVIIFTEYRASQEYLLQYLRDRKITAVPYRGGMNRGKKDWMMDLFRNRAQVLIATEAGGEGINLQFCHHMINFDLPWNPMRVEQRIGRVHRLGQQQDVKIYNLSTTGTIEEHILSLLHEKINMFELVIGELDTILERLEQDTPLESHLAKLILTARDSNDIRRQIDDLGESFTTLRGSAAAAPSPEEHPGAQSAPFSALLNAVGQTVTQQMPAAGEVQL